MSGSYDQIGKKLYQACTIKQYHSW